MIRVLTTNYFGRNYSLTKIVMHNKTNNIDNRFKALINLIEKTKYFKVANKKKL